MDHSKIQTLIKDQNWSELAAFVESEFNKSDSEFQESELLQFFCEIDEEFREKNLIGLYPKTWKIAFSLGQIKIARKLVSSLLEHLINNKRQNQLKILHGEIQNLLSKKAQAPFEMLEIYSGFKKITNEDDYEFVQLHPEQWKHNKEAYKNHLMYEANWDIEGLKLIYEYIIRFHFDKEILMYLAEKNLEIDNASTSDFNKNFIKLFKSKKIETYHLENYKKKEIAKEKIDNKTLDLMALNLFSKQELITDEESVITYLKFLSEDELKEKGQDMIVSFSFLSMSKVVRYLCEELLKISKEMKERVSLHYAIAQSLYDCENYYKSIDVAFDVMEEEVLLENEKIAFKYLIAECYLALDRKDKAKVMYKEVMKSNPHYRLVKERLSEI